MAGALDGIRVVELGTGISASSCTKLLADYGAEVVKVEPPEGDPMRRYGPFPGDKPDLEKSGLFLDLNTNKRSVTLTLNDPSAVEIVERLAGWADAIVENFEPGYLASLGLSYERLRTLNPRLVLMSITPFGQYGPYSHWPATEMVLFAMSGRMFGHGRQDREPLRYVQDLVWFQAGTTAAAAVMAALWGARLNTCGTWIDLSIQEAMAGSVDSRVVMASYSGTSGGRSYRAQDYPRGAYPCKDGFMLFAAGSDRHFRRLCHAIGRTDMLVDDRWATSASRVAHRDEWEAAFLDWTVDRTRGEVFEACQAEGVLCAPVLKVDEVLKDPQFVSREFFTSVPCSRVGDLTLPGPPFRMQEGGWSIRRPAPLLGQHNTEVYGGVLGYTAEQIARLNEEGVV